MTIVVAGLVLWIVLVFALLVWEPAMWRAHIAHLVPPMALLAALRPAPWPVLAVVGLVAAPFFVSNNRSILWPDGYTGHEAALVHHLERFPIGRAVHQRRPWLGVAIGPPAAGRLRRHVLPAHRRPRDHRRVAGEGGGPRATSAA